MSGQDGVRGATAVRLSAEEHERIDFLRILLVLLLVLLHFGGLYGANYNPNLGYVGQDEAFAAIVVSYIHFLGFTAVPALSAISGYLFFMGARPGKAPDFLRKVKSRVRSLGLPFLIWSTVFMLLGYALFRLLPGQYSDVFAPADGNLVRSIGNAWLGIDGFPLAIQLWFVRDLIVTVLISPLIWLLVSRVPVPLLLGLLVLWFAEHDLWIFTKLDVVGFFTLGAAFAVHGWRRDLPRRWVLPLLAVFLLLVLLRSLAPALLDIEPESRGLYIATCLMRIVGLVTVWSAAPLLMGGLLGAITPQVSYMAFFMHCAHFPPIIVVKMLFGRLLDPAGSLVHLAVYFGTVIVTIAVIALAAHLMRHATPRLFSVLSGGRTGPKTARSAPGAAEPRNLMA
ncbi:acyltransferase [Rhodobacteraceae bacterium DSL-40]|uniref:acyltransferase family protein n=1 Tax=Amaricoccus sp. B4 TaxID=3368557 RepID=UPI000DAEBED7